MIARDRKWPYLDGQLGSGLMMAVLSGFAQSALKNCRRFIGVANSVSIWSGLGVFFKRPRKGFSVEKLEHCANGVQQKVHDRGGRFRYLQSTAGEKDCNGWCCWLQRVELIIFWKISIFRRKCHRLRRYRRKRIPPTFLLFTQIHVFMTCHHCKAPPTD